LTGPSPLLRKILVDRASLFALATKVFQGAGGVVTAVLILRFFSPEVQGYYYTFANVLALQVFLELGLSAVITTFAAHEWSRLSLESDGGITGDRQALARLRSLARQVTAWYLTGGFLLLLLLTVIGLWFFDSQDKSGTVEWQHPWIAMCLLTSLNFFLIPAWALLSGCGQIANVNAYRMIDTVIRYAALWVCIALGASLWSAVGAAALSAFGGWIFLLVLYRRFLRDLLLNVPSERIGWFKELFPLQIRIALSWISGYFVAYVFTPVIFYFLGASEAGRMGMTWAFISGLSGIAATWLQAQAPGFSILVARKEFAALDLSCVKTVWIGVAVFFSGCCIGIAILALLRIYRPDLADRFIPIGSIAVFLIAECLQQVSMVQATYLRAFKQEPFLGLSVMSAFIVGGGTLWLTPTLGFYGPAFSYLTAAVVGIAWGSLIFVQKRRQWTSYHPVLSKDD